MAAALPLLSACDGLQSTLAPDGPKAAAVAELYWFLLAVATLTCLLVVGLLAYALFHRREFRGQVPPLRLAPRSEQLREKRLRVARGEAEGSSDDRELTESDREPLEVDLHTGESDRRAVRWVVLAGAIIPAFVLTGALLYTLHTLRTTTDNDGPDLTIEVIGRQWWWEVVYLDPQGRRLFETANEIHIPQGKRVRFRLKSADVIHSFWVPQLAGKLDMIPGRTTELFLQADNPGMYRGQCAEYCEEQHAKMSLLVFADPQPHFDAWAARQARGEVRTSDRLAAAGREVFLNTACSACHAVRGTPAAGDLGPDLTHVASRRTLAAVTIPNTRGHMGGWLTNPHQIKPGVHMPAVPLDSDAFIALLRYMETLE